nr:M18 family aminopeptidase [Propionibacterium cyclohexanicum]
MAPRNEFTEGFIDFLAASPTSFHAASAMAHRLDEAGFTPLDEKQGWGQVSGRHYFVRGGALLAWVAPEQLSGRAAFRIVGAHNDSPALKLKPDPGYTAAGWQQLNMEVYGGPLLNSFLDRELGLAGRIVERDGSEHLVRTGAIMRVSQLAPHLDRSVNDKLSIDRQFQLMPSFGLGEEPDIIELLCGQAGIGVGDLAFAEVLSYPTQEPAVFGNHEEFLASARLDNLSSVYPALVALERMTDSSDVAVLAAFDHEEVGSATASGAAGPILADALARIARGLGVSGDAWYAMLARSSCISSDAAHSVNPNHLAKYDPQTWPMMNQGPALKVNAQQRYATDGPGAALWQRACRAAGVPSQVFVSNNDVPCGSTIGPITATRLGISTVDVGIPILSMHSAREMCGTADPGYLSGELGAYWQGA